MGGRLRGAIPKGPSGGQAKSGASCSGSEGLVGGEHVPDGGGQSAGDVDLGDLGAALATKSALGVLVAVAIGAVSERVHRGFEHRPAQAFRAGLGQRATGIVGILVMVALIAASADGRNNES
jgi:hypothetical protein